VLLVELLAGGAVGCNAVACVVLAKRWWVVGEMASRAVVCYEVSTKL
jgi:hypothetical protein